MMMIGVVIEICPTSLEFSAFLSHPLKRESEKERAANIIERGRLGGHFESRSPRLTEQGSEGSRKERKKAIKNYGTIVSFELLYFSLLSFSENGGYTQPSRR